MYLMGLDVGSSSVKASLMNAETGQVLAAATSPKQELEIAAPQSGWAEQHPDTWWEHAKKAIAELAATSGVDLKDVTAIGISYQMHGLVLVDDQQEVLRPAIIWCDSRAVEIGDRAAQALGSEACLQRMRNLPGNFTASKLRWVQENEPDIYRRVHKFMLPGDYIAMKLTGQITTTASGLSEGILWDFSAEQPASLLLDHYDIDPALIADIVPTFAEQGQVSRAAAAELGLAAGTKIAYRGGDQPNNALSLNVLQPGEIAATAGTSGVVYGVTDQSNYDALSRVNTFVHVNHTPSQPRCGVLLCVNGTGILNSWVRSQMMEADISYPEMNRMAQSVPVGAEGLAILPYGNGAERTLNNHNLGASIHGLHFNVHKRAHMLRAAQEGIVFALNYGLEIMREMGVQAQTVRAGDANMFLSPLFGQAFACVTQTQVQLYNTDGSLGAARGAGLGAGIYGTAQEAFATLKTTRTIDPDPKLIGPYQRAYQHWQGVLQSQLN